MRTILKVPRIKLQWGWLALQGTQLRCTAKCIRCKLLLLTWSSLANDFIFSFLLVNQYDDPISGSFFVQNIKQTCYVHMMAFLLLIENSFGGKWRKIKVIGINKVQLTAETIKWYLNPKKRVAWHLDFLKNLCTEGACKQVWQTWRTSK